MKIFLSWSGERSLSLANALSSFFRRVLQSTQCWISPNDLLKGKNWPAELKRGLEENSVGVICLTQESVESKWIFFEAGALSKLPDSLVAPYLLDGEIEHLHPSLANLNVTRFTKDDTYRLIRSINSVLEPPVPEPVWSEQFEMWWADFEKAVKEIPAPSTTEITKETDEAKRLDRIEHALADLASKISTAQRVRYSRRRPLSTEAWTKALNTVSSPGPKDLQTYSEIVDRLARADISQKSALADLLGVPVTPPKDDQQPKTT